MGTFFRASGTNKRVGISLVEGYKREGKSVISVCKGPKKVNRPILWLISPFQNIL